MFEQIINEEKNDFYPIDKTQIIKAEERMGIKFPYELRKFYEEVGYGFIGCSEGYAINRLIAPLGCSNIRLREGYYEADSDLEMYERYEKEFLLFFEINEGVYASIRLDEKEKSEIYFASDKIADSLEEFLIKIKDADYWSK